MPKFLQNYAMLALAEDTCPALLATLTWLAPKVLLLNTTQQVKCRKEVGHLQNAVGHLQNGVGHLTRYPS